MFPPTALPPAPAPTWKKIAPGIWRTQVGKKDGPTLTDVTEAKPRLDRLKQLGESAFPLPTGAIGSETNGEQSVIRLPLAPDEKIFGLGLQMQGSNRRGGVFHLRVDHYESGQDRLHAPTPLYVSSKGYAVFFNTIRPIDVYLGVGNRLNDPNRPPFRDRNTDPHWDAQPDSGTVEASVHGKGLEVLVLTGPTAMAALQRYNLFCGGGPMPPAWALGFWHRTPSLASASDVMAEAAEYARRGFPLDVLGLEPGWQARSYPGTMEWSPVRFPSPTRFLQDAKAKGIHVNLWENPYVAPGSELFRELSPNFGSHTVWLGAAPDLGVRAAADTVRRFHTAHHVDLGVSGYKIDEIDGFDVWLWPDHATFPSGLDGLRMRQIYGLLWQRELDRLFRDKNERTFGLVRGSNGGGSRFPFAIYSDTYDHRQYVTASVNAALAGVIWCAEVREAANGAEWVRRMQSACLSPIAQLNAWSSGTKPWSFPDVEGPVREAMCLRSSLFPYLYATFAHYWRDGLPPARPMSLVDGGLETDQYLLGDSLLVAPMFANQTHRRVRLPAGKWYEFATGRYAGSDQVIEVTPGLDQIPLYVRGGVALPTITPVLHLAEIDAKTPYQFLRFGEGPWRGEIYEDDGHTFAYERGDYALTEVTVDRGGNITLRRLDGTGQASGRTMILKGS